MPYLKKSTYRPIALFRNNHLNTMHASLFRKIEPLSFQRERISTYDKDFLDLDIAYQNKNKVVILLHGLEGNSTRNYMLGMANHFHTNDWDVVSMNFRGCSGEPNALPRSYHVGETGDLKYVLNFILEKNQYHSIALVGFSMGGNIILKYLGEEREKIHPKIKTAVALSVPCDIPSANVEMEKWHNWHYRKYLVNALREKYKRKIEMYPQQFAIPQENWQNTFRSFDEHYTAPAHGFSSAMEYWTINSSIHYLEDIRIPTLLINALDDSFLSPECYPRELAANHKYFHLETPEYGGHIGFSGEDDQSSYWSERRTLEFISSFIQ